MPAVLSILLVTEDSGKQGYGTISALSVEMLRLVDTQARFTKECVNFEPLQNNQARLALRGNGEGDVGFPRLRGSSSPTCAIGACTRGVGRACS